MANTAGKPSRSQAKTVSRENDETITAEAIHVGLAKPPEAAAIIFMIIFWSGAAFGWGTAYAAARTLLRFCVNGAGKIDWRGLTRATK